MQLPRAHLSYVSSDSLDSLQGGPARQNWLGAHIVRLLNQGAEPSATTTPYPPEIVARRLVLTPHGNASLLRCFSRHGTAKM